MFEGNKSLLNLAQDKGVYCKNAFFFYLKKPEQLGLCKTGKHESPGSSALKSSQTFTIMIYHYLS